MKKFIAAFDGLDFSESTLQYAIHLTQKANAHLVGVFLEDFTRRSYGMNELAHYSGEDMDTYVHEMDEKDKHVRDESIDRFKKVCSAAGISYTIHRDRNVALQELLHESIYADLLIIGSAETLTRYEEGLPTRFLRDLLNDVQCPVVVVPAIYQAFDSLILLYDGEPSSVHAVRTFSYLFEDLKSLPTEIVSVKEQREATVLPDARLIREFVRGHFPAADAVILKGDPDDVIIGYLQRKKNSSLVVLGAYQRSRFSRLFKPSMADHLLHYLKLPLFIAHNKS